MSYNVQDMSDGPPQLSEKEALILALLVARGAMYGLEFVEESDGTLKRGTIYVTLSRMMDKGYVTSFDEAAPPGSRGPARRKYKITGLGERAHAAHRSALAAWRKGVALA
jgi:PadR family transcriptional regulator, regulatory protein PadR